MNKQPVLFHLILWGV